MNAIYVNSRFVNITLTHAEFKQLYSALLNNDDEREFADHYVRSASGAPGVKAYGTMMNKITEAHNHQVEKAQLHNRKTPTHGQSQA